ncbi:MAG: single-stranded-DNA-specific exonuclease RecJ [Peptostreptococcaceae bacterium]|nr:single-stranded-DNA-specific exonuclease RecJ [Peptostreptococcaceae bacterium]
MEKWLLKKRNFWPEDISKNFDIPLPVAEILARRNFTTFEEIDHYLKRNKEMTHDPFLMKDMEKSVNILCSKIKNNEKILISLDYDVDGIISGAISYLGFQKLGMQCECIFPHRIKDGYGINDRIVRYAIDNGFGTIITFDNGISAFDAINFAIGQGLDVIVTDHHEIPQILQDGLSKDHLISATSIINPKQQDCLYPFKKICGAMIAYKLLLALNLELGFREEDLADVYPLVSIATICDVMDLEDENRIYVYHGLDRLKNISNMGLQALMKLLDLGSLTVYDIGFRIGPCFNSSGRLSTAQKSFDLLVTDDPDVANKLATELIGLNDERKQMTLQATEVAIQKTEEDLLHKNNIIILFLEDVHESLAGIVAGRLKDRYNIPSIVFCYSEGSYKGSARSTEDINIFDILSSFKHYFEKFGGHAAAAGMSLSPSAFESFVSELTAHMNAVPLSRKKTYYVDALFPFSVLTMDLVKKFHIFEPTGKGNPEILLATTKIQVRGIERIGKNNNVLKLRLASNKTDRYFVSFSAEKILEIIKNKMNLSKEHDIINILPKKISETEFDILYKVKINEYNDREYLNLELISIR